MIRDLNKQTIRRTARAMPRWDIGEDVRNVWRCLSDKNYRPIMTGEWVSDERLQNALKPLNQPDYAEWNLHQYAEFKEKAIKGQALYAIISHYRDHIIQHGGLCAEFGVFQGYSLKMSAEMLPECQWYGFDSFEGFEQEWQMNNNQYALRKDAFSLGGHVPELALANVSLVKGYFSDSLPKFVANLSDEDYFSLVHIDCDTFDAVESVFTYLGDRVVPGTIIVMDDLVGLIGITDAMKAFYEFVQNKNIQFEWLLCGRGPNDYTVLDRGCVMTHWLFANKIGMFSAACMLK